MNLDLRLDSGDLPFVGGFPSAFSEYLLPQAETIHFTGEIGTICIQEIKADKYLLRHFLFRLKRKLSFHITERNEGLQTLMSLKGEIDYQIHGLKSINLKEREYILFDAQSKKTTTTINEDSFCSVLNAYYAPDAYFDLLQLFPSFKKDLKKAARKSYHFLYPPTVARYTVHDAIQSIWFDRYVQTLQKKHIEIRLRSSLFTLLAQTYTSSPHETISLQEKEKAAAAREIILRNIAKHLTPEQIAAELFCSPGWLKKAFSKVYGIGMFHYLRRTRMEIAREMLLKGESLKAVALEVGMKPRNFPKEFKTFFGYTVTALKKGLS
jgi:AraC-like DNA-binding protein